jgi:hypothetical protein
VEYTDGTRLGLGLGVQVELGFNVKVFRGLGGIRVGGKGRVG